MIGIMAAPIPAPPETEAGGMLTIDLGGARRQLARRSRARAAPAECARRRQGRRLRLRHRAGRARARAAPAAGPSSSPISSEAQRARAPRRTPTIYVLNGLLPGTAPAYARRATCARCSAARTNSPNGTRSARRPGWRGGAALHVDTGMNRLGLRSTRPPRLRATRSASDHGIALLMSHFACAEDAGHPLNAQPDRRASAKCARCFPALPARSPIRPASSSGPDAHRDLVRPGAALYGGNPDARPAEPDAAGRRRCKARIVQVRDVAAGETVGYGATWTAQRPTAARHRRRSATPTAFRARRAAATGKPAPTRSSRASAARSSAASRWT